MAGIEAVGGWKIWARAQIPIAVNIVSQNG
jgi:hypothetical protein